MKSFIPEHRSDKVVQINIVSCARCGDPMPSRSRKKFCGSCSDLNAEERRRAAYLARRDGKTRGSI